MATFTGQLAGVDRRLMERRRGGLFGVGGESRRVGDKPGTWRTPAAPGTLGTQAVEGKIDPGSLSSGYFNAVEGDRVVKQDAPLTGIADQALRFQQTQENRARNPEAGVMAAMLGKGEEYNLMNAQARAAQNLSTGQNRRAALNLQAQQEQSALQQGMGIKAKIANGSATPEEIEEYIQFLGMQRRVMGI